jgi:Predicted transcriptional regulators
MSSIQIGKVISTKRKEKGITQEELAQHLRVSKPAVSKWESGQSYPDIMLLPVLASYFNISVDDLIGYEPQMTKEDVRKLYHRLAKDFAKTPFEVVYEECEELIKKYFSCWFLQFEIGLLYANHCSLAGSPERINQIIRRAIEIFERVEKSGDDVSLAKQSMLLKALCYISLNQPIEAIDILENNKDVPMQPETLLVKAYQMKGDKEKAIEYLQGNAYYNLSSLLGLASDFFMMYADQPERMDSYYDIFIRLCDVFDMKQLYPASLFTIYLTAATSYVMQNRNEKAIDVLEKYVDLVNQSYGKEFTLHGSNLFDALDKYLATVDIETVAPRSTEVIWRDIKNAIANNPSFAPLEDIERFKKLKKRLPE